MFKILKARLHYDVIVTSYADGWYIQRGVATLLSEDVLQKMVQEVWMYGCISMHQISSSPDFSALKFQNLMCTKTESMLKSL